MKKSKLLLASAIISSMYLFYLMDHFSIAPEAIGNEFAGAVAVAIIAPHAFLVGLATLFNWIGWANKSSVAVLTAGILYSVSSLLMLMYAPFVLLQIIFCFVVHSKMKKYNKNDGDI